MSSKRRTDSKRVIDSLLKNVRCHMCADYFKDPRLLDCFHMYCKNCLDSYIEFTCPDGHIDCPLCDASTKTPRKGAAGLKKNIYLNLNSERIGVTCDVCEGEEKNFAAYKCIDCAQDFCENCLKYHSSIATTREHHIASFDREQASVRVNRDLYCKIHTEEKLSYYCRECDELVCQHCNMTTHKQHTSRYVMDLSDSFRNDLTNVIKSDEYKNYALWMVDKRDELSQEKKRIVKLEEEAVKAIHEQAKLLHSIVDKVKASLLNKTAEETSHKVRPIKNCIVTIDKDILSYISVFLIAKHAAERADEIEIVNSGQKLIKKLEKLKWDNTLPKIPRDEGVRFIPSDADVDIIQSQFGIVTMFAPPGNPEMLHKFSSNQGGSTISGVLPTDDGRAWIVDGMDGLLQQYDTSGRIHKTFHLGVPADDLINGLDKTMYVSCNSSKEVRVINDKLKVSKLISTENCVRGIAYDSNDGSLVMCITEKNAFFDYESHHNNKVLRTVVNTKKKRLETPDVLSFAGFPVVEYPARLAVTKSGFIAISDWKRNCVTILDKRGHVKSEYFGHRKGANSQAFCPRGICSDLDGRILAADYNNDRIMLLDESGQTFHAVLTAEDDIRSPWSVAMGSDGILWVGSKNGQVCVYNPRLGRKLVSQNGKRENKE